MQISLLKTHFQNLKQHSLPPKKKEKERKKSVDFCSQELIVPTQCKIGRYVLTSQDQHSSMFSLYLIYLMFFVFPHSTGRIPGQEIIINFPQISVSK